MKGIKSEPKSDTIRLNIKKISKSFGATPALNQVSFSVKKGKIHALIGENGAGKSTLMKIIAGVIQADSGNIKLDNQEFKPRDPYDARSQGVATIHQELSVADHLSVEENITLGCEPCFFGIINKKKRREIVSKALNKIGHSELSPEAITSKLSAGLRQIVEITRAIVLGSKLIILDEPTSSISKSDTARLFTLLRLLKSEGHSIIFISHHLEEIFEIADEYTVMRDGQVVGCGQISDSSPAAIVKQMAGREIKELYPEKTSKIKLSRPILNLTIKVRRDSAPINLSLEGGEILGIAGLLGSGRSKFLRSIFGLHHAYETKISFLKNEINPSPDISWHKGIGFLSEDRAKEGLALGMNISENIHLVTKPSDQYLAWIGFHEERVSSLQLIKDLKIKALSPYQKVKQLSGGNQQKIALARILAQDTKLILLDEPTRGIDIQSKAEIYLKLREFVENSTDHAIIIVSSYIPELLGLCDKIAVMSRLGLSPARPASELNEHIIMEAAFGYGEKNETVGQ